MPNNVWFTPVCDIILKKVNNWYRFYTKGEVFASRPYLSLDGRVEERPTIYANKLSFSEFELKHFVRLLELTLPKADVTKVVCRAYEGVRKKQGILIPPNYYLITLAIYPNDVKEVIDALTEAKTGVKQDMSDLVGENKDKEKAPFEL
jgi:hypothetical protein